MHFLIVKSERIYNNKWTFDFVFITLSTHTIVCVTIHSTRAFSDTTVINGIIVEFSIRTGCYYTYRVTWKKEVNWKLNCVQCMYVCIWNVHACIVQNLLSLFWARVTQITQTARHSSRPRHLHSMISQKESLLHVKLGIFTCMQLYSAWEETLLLFL